MKLPIGRNSRAARWQREDYKIGINFCVDFISDFEKRCLELNLDTAIAAKIIREMLQDINETIKIWV